MRIRSLAAALLLASALAGCSPEFVPADAESGFAVSGELELYPHHELVGGGLGSFTVYVRSVSNRPLRNVKVAVFYPDEIAQVSRGAHTYLASPRSYDLTPEQPSYGLGQTFAFPDRGQAEAVRALAAKPLRVRVAWDGGERLLEVPPEAITVTQEDEPRRLDLSAADEPGGLTRMWSHLRQTEQITGDAAIRIARARYADGPENQWSAACHPDGTGSGAASPAWEVTGLLAGRIKTAPPGRRGSLIAY